MKPRHLFSPLAVIMALLAAGQAHGADPGALSLAEARDLALKTHPGITYAELRALAAKEQITEVRSGYLPLVAANATAVGTGETVTRLSAGSLSNSQIYDHVGVGATLSQLITDFGRTANLTGAAKLHARAADANVQVVRAQLLLAVDTAFLNALEARAVRAVAAKTLANRQLLFDQIGALAKNQLKSELDVRFAQVGVGEARLLVDKADDDWQSSLATLANLMGQRPMITAELLEVPSPTDDLPADPEPLVDLALRDRPELLGQRSERDAAQDIAQAAKDARLPTLSALGSAGIVPVRNVHFEQNYAAAGVNLNLPLFTGGLYRARQREAEFQAGAATAALSEMENNIIRDLRLAWLEAGHARERIALTASLLESATSALDLAHARFDQGLSSIVELNQSELAQVSAEIAHTNAEYEYRVRRDILNYQIGSLH
jgi:outer membrane protein